MNLQNVAKPTKNPLDADYGYSVKSLYQSRFKNGVIVNADYSSLEVHVATFLSRDTGMTKALLKNEDIHKRNASIAYQVPVSEVTPVQRQLAKAVSFGKI